MLPTAANILIPALPGGACECDFSSRVVEVMDFFNLSSHSKTKARDLPHGHQRLLGLAVAFSTNPTLLLIDEPVTGMNKAEEIATIKLLK